MNRDQFKIPDLPKLFPNVPLLWFKMLHSVAVTGAEQCKAGKLAANAHAGHLSENESQRNE